MVAPRHGEAVDCPELRDLHRRIRACEERAAEIRRRDPQLVRSERALQDVLAHLFLLRARLPRHVADAHR